MAVAGTYFNLISLPVKIKSTIFNRSSLPTPYTAMKKQTGRRSFLKKIGVGSVSAAILPASILDTGSNWQNNFR